MIGCDAVFHIGFGNTGSSAIQSYLSASAALPIRGTSFLYCAFDATGAVSQGPDLARRAAKTPLGYISSTPAMLGPDAAARLSNEIKSIRLRGFTPIFSQEDWSRTGRDFVKILFHAGLNVRVIAYVRPQVEWFNSGWWQWWRWTDKFNGDPKNVIDAWAENFLLWPKQLDAWGSSECVKAMTIRLHCADVVRDFLEQIGASTDVDIPRVNQSLDPLILKLYQAIPGLRGPHGGELDAVLTPLLSSGGKAPWVVSQSLAARIVAGTYDDNLRLLGYLTPDQKAAVQVDARWWDAEAYASRTVEQLSPLSATEGLEILQRVVPSSCDCAYPLTRESIGVWLRNMEEALPIYRPYFRAGFQKEYLLGPRA